MLVEVLASVVGDFRDDLPRALVEAAAAGDALGDVEGSQQERTGFVIHGARGDRVHDLYDGVLYRFAALDDEQGSDARVDGHGHTADYTLVEIAKVLAFQSGRFAGVSGDMDVGAARSGLRVHSGVLECRRRFGAQECLRPLAGRGTIFCKSYVADSEMVRW